MRTITITVDEAIKLTGSAMKLPMCGWIELQDGRRLYGCLRGPIGNRKWDLWIRAN